MRADYPSAEDSEEKILVAGFGGQGVLFLGHVLAWAALLQGKEVTWLPSYGPSMRGGTANCMVIMSARKIVSPFVQSPRVALILNKPSLLRFGSTVLSGGWLIVDSSIADIQRRREEIHYIAVPASEIAHKLGPGHHANMVLAGVYAALFPHFLTREVGLQALDRISAGERAHLVERNRIAFEAGLNCGDTFR